MADSELRDLITEGAKKTNLTFLDSVIGLITRLSSGYPHFTHLLALKCSEEAIATDLPEIDRHCLLKAIHSAVEDAEGALRRQYDDATRSHNTEMYRTVLLAASRLGRDEFSATHLRETIEKITQEPISQGSLNNFLQRLVSDDYTSILHRCSKGVYKFSDPRMPSFVRIANEELEDEAQPRDPGDKE